MLVDVVKETVLQTNAHFIVYFLTLLSLSNLPVYQCKVDMHSYQSKPMENTALHCCFYCEIFSCEIL